MKSRNWLKSMGIAGGILWALTAVSAQATLRIDVTGGAVQPIPVAVAAFALPEGGAAPAGQASSLGRDIAQTISADLARSGLFRAIGPAYHPVGMAPPATPDYGAWRQSGAQALVGGFVQHNADGSLLVGCYLYDVFDNQEVVRQGFTVSGPQFWRRAAHKCSDLIYTRLTGEQGYFDSRLVYVAETGPRNARIKRLAIMDQDGANVRYLTNGQHLVLTPRFSPVEQEITFMSYESGAPKIYLYNITTGRRELVANYPNMSFSPRFAPDGRSVVLSLTEGGVSDLYRLDLSSRVLNRLTNTLAIDSSASFSPDGQQIVFESNQGGSQQIYVMPAGGGAPRRISYDASSPGARYGTPVWSPRGDWVAFTKMSNGRFAIGVMRPDGSGERILTNSWQDEGPSWSPNGRVILFFRTMKSDKAGRGGSSQLWSVDLAGTNERRISTPTDASDPAWSPLLP